MVSHRWRRLRLDGSRLPALEGNFFGRAASVRLQDVPRQGDFVEHLCERREVLIAFQENTLYGGVGDDEPEDIPDLFADRSAMIINHHPVHHSPAGDVHLYDALKRERLQEFKGVRLEVDRVDMHVVNVQEHSAIGFFEDTRDELRFAHLAQGNREVVGDVFQQERRAREALDASHVPANHIEGFFSEPEGRQLADVGLRHFRETEVVAEPWGVRPLYEFDRPPQIIFVHRHVSADRHADAMRHQRERLRVFQELLCLLGWRVDKLVSDDFKEVNTCAVTEYILVQRCPVPEADAKIWQRTKHNVSLHLAGALRNQLAPVA